MKRLFKALILVLPLVIMMGCSTDDHITPIPSTQISKTYTVSSIYDYNVSGTAKFIKNDDNSTTVELEITGIPEESLYPASINYNTAAQGGSVAITLGNVDGDTGLSTVSFSTLDDGTPITYDDLLGFDGYVNVLYSADEPDNNMAQADIGENELTGVSTTYSLGEKDESGISGSVIFSERENGEALAVFQLINTISGDMYPTFLNNNTAVEGGSVALTFNPINGDTGISATNVSALDDAVSFLYIDVVDFDGYIDIQQNEATPEIIIAEGDIGQNQLSGVVTSYVLDEVNGSGVSGTATFYGRNNGEALAVILLINTTLDVMHPAYIYSNDIATGGDIIFTFNPIDGNTGVSQTNVAVLNDNSLFGYAEVLGVDGHINVLLSEVITTVISQGNIGAND